ncbi:MAG: dTDP-4-dehydrorhamnose reductase [Thermoplasmata archaeon]
MRALVVGGAGQVGRRVAGRLRAAGAEVLATYLARPPPEAEGPRAPLDKTDVEAVRALLRRFRPELVVDTGALHNVDYCESHPEEADRVNHLGTANLARAAGENGARMIFVSTDFVFDGTGRRPYPEEAEPHPQSAYAVSKLAGEAATLAADGRNIVVRPSVVYSWTDTRRRAESSSGKGTNFGTWLVEEVRRGREVRILNDQIASPTLADDLAEAIVALAGELPGGIYHAAGTTAVDRHAFSVRLVARLGLDPARVRPVSTAELGQKAPRPTDSSLSSERLRRMAGHRMLTLPEQLDRFARDVADDPGVDGLAR